MCIPIKIKGLFVKVTHTYCMLVYHSLYKNTSNTRDVIIRYDITPDISCFCLIIGCWKKETCLFS